MLDDVGWPGIDATASPGDNTPDDPVDEWKTDDGTTEGETDGGDLPSAKLPETSEGLPAIDMPLKPTPEETLSIAIVPDGPDPRPEPTSAVSRNGTEVEAAVDEKTDEGTLDGGGGAGIR